MIHDDASIFNHVSKSFIREHFRSWIKQLEGSNKRDFHRLRKHGELQEQSCSWPLVGDTPRMSYCIHVDAEALASVVEFGATTSQLDYGRETPSEQHESNTNAHKIDKHTDHCSAASAMPNAHLDIPSVNLIDAAWTGTNPDTLTSYDYFAPPDTYDEISVAEHFPEIDGSTLEDVGWMKVAMKDVRLEVYGTIAENERHYQEMLYVRPPSIGSADGFLIFSDEHERDRYWSRPKKSFP